MTLQHLQCREINHTLVGHPWGPWKWHCATIQRGPRVDKDNVSRNPCQSSSGLMWYAVVKCGMLCRPIDIYISQETSWQCGYSTSLPQIPLTTPITATDQLNTSNQSVERSHIAAWTWTNNLNKVWVSAPIVDCAGFAHWPLLSMILGGALRRGGFGGLMIGHLCHRRGHRGSLGPVPKATGTN